MDMHNEDNNILVDLIDNLRPKEEREVSKDLYNAGIEYAKQHNINGIITGRNLMSPEQTYSI